MAFCYQKSALQYLPSFYFNTKLISNLSTLIMLITIECERIMNIQHRYLEDGLKIDNIDKNYFIEYFCFFFFNLC